MSRPHQGQGSGFSMAGSRRLVVGPGLFYYLVSFQLLPGLRSQTSLDFSENQGFKNWGGVVVGKTVMESIDFSGSF